MSARSAARVLVASLLVVACDSHAEHVARSPASASAPAPAPMNEVREIREANAALVAPVRRGGAYAILNPDDDASW